MTKTQRIPAMIAIAGLMSAPVFAFAQTGSTTGSTTGTTGTSSTMSAPAGAPNGSANGVMPGTPGSAATAPGAAPGGMLSSAPGNGTTGGNATYETKDQKVRASKVIGSSVYDDQNNKIGSVDDLLMDQNHDVTGVVLSVGGFLGVGSKLVQVPYNQLKVDNDKLVLNGATKDQLTKMPSYSYTGNT